MKFVEKKEKREKEKYSSSLRMALWLGGWSDLGMTSV